MKIMSIPFVLVLAVLLSTSLAGADFYRYRDENGGINLTNDPKSIPQRYLSGVEVVRESDLERRQAAEKRNGEKRRKQPLHDAAATAAPNASVPAAIPSAAADIPTASSPSAQQPGWIDRQLPLLRIIGVIVLAVAGFVVAGRVVSSLAPRSLAFVIRIVMLVAIVVYLFKGYSEKIVAAFALVKNESNAAQHAVDKRSERLQNQAE